MITHRDQLQLFTLISRQLKKDVECWAFGGTAMMFYGFKGETKDIDVLFEDDKSKAQFIAVITGMGFKESSPMGIYIPEKLKDKSKPVMYKREDYRMDLFAGKIFRTNLSPRMKEDKFAVHDFKDNQTLRINVFRTEHIVLLKGITERKNDFDDIRTILSKDSHFDWQYLVDEAIWQHEHGDSWVLLDIEKMMQGLKEYMLIEEKYFNQLYKAQGKGRRQGLSNRKP